MRHRVHWRAAPNLRLSEGRGLAQRWSGRLLTGHAKASSSPQRLLSRDLADELNGTTESGSEKVCPGVCVDRAHAEHFTEFAICSPSGRAWGFQAGKGLRRPLRCLTRAGARIDYTSDSSMPGSTIVTQSESGPAALDGCTSG